jgi:hypothetical protein
MKRLLVLAACAATAAVVLASPAGAAQPAVQPQVIGGTPGSPLASAAVAIDLSDGSCTASLWRSRILITAAHCVSDPKTGAATVPAGNITVYPPGADASGPPANVRVTQILFDPGWTADSPDGESEERDIAFLILDAPLGAPTWSRMATPAEVVQLARSGAEVEYVGYGLTGPRNDPASQGSPIPLSLKSRLAPSYAGGTGQITIKGDGVRGTCAGDSGGPFLAYIGGTLVYLGPLSGGLGFPCESEQDEPSDTAAVAAGLPDLAQQALAAAGEGAEPTPTTCIEGADVERECVPGTVWNYSYCWSGKRAVLQVRVANKWKTVRKVTGRRTGDCESSTPFEFTFGATADQASASYRLVFPRQPGLRRGAVDPFTITSG